MSYLPISRTESALLVYVRQRKTDRLLISFFGTVRDFQSGVLQASTHLGDGVLHQRTLGIGMAWKPQIPYLSSGRFQ